MLFLCKDSRWLVSTNRLTKSYLSISGDLDWTSHRKVWHVNTILQTNANSRPAACNHTYRGDIGINKPHRLDQRREHIRCVPAKVGLFLARRQSL